MSEGGWWTGVLKDLSLCDQQLQETSLMLNLAIIHSSVWCNQGWSYKVSTEACSGLHWPALQSSNSLYGVLAETARRSKRRLKQGRRGNGNVWGLRIVVPGKAADLMDWILTAGLLMNDVKQHDRLGRRDWRTTSASACRNVWNTRYSDLYEKTDATLQTVRTTP